MRTAIALLVLAGCASPAPEPAPPVLRTHGHFTLSPDGLRVALFPEPDRLAVVSAADGSAIWSAPACSSIRPLWTGGGLWAATSPAVLARFDAADGRILESVPLLRQGREVKDALAVQGADAQGDLLLQHRVEAGLHVKKAGRCYPLPGRSVWSAMRPDGSLVLSLVNGEQGRELWTYEVQGSWKLKQRRPAPHPFALAAPGRELETVYLAEHGGRQLWSLARSAPEFTLRATVPAIEQIVASADGSTLVVGHVDGRLRVHDFDSLEQRREIQAGRTPASIAVSGDGRVVAWLEGDAVRISR